MLEIQQKRRYVAKTRELAFSEIKNEFGDDFVVIYEKEIFEGGFFGFFATRKFEVMVGRLPVREQPGPAQTPPPFTREFSQANKREQNQDILEELLLSVRKNSALTKSSPAALKSASAPEPNPQVARYLAEILGGSPHGLYQNPALGKVASYKAGGLPVRSDAGNPSMAEVNIQLREILKEFGSIKKTVSQMEERFKSVGSGNNDLQKTPETEAVAVRAEEPDREKSVVFENFVGIMEDHGFSRAMIKTYHNILQEEFSGREPSLNDLCESFRSKYLKTIAGKFKGSFLSESVEEAEAEPYDENQSDSQAEEKPRVAVFVGPTGVGKTTTVVKYACSLLNEGKSVVLIAADTFKMGAVEQLQFFAEKMNMGFDVVYELEKLPEHIARHQHADYILIDTVGRSPLSKGQLSRMQRNLPEDLNAEVHLVISAVAKYQDMEKIILGYRVFCADYLLFTKLDETFIYGPVLSILQKWQRKVSFLTNGQTVPGDICLCSEKAVGRLVFNGGLASANV